MAALILSMLSTAVKPAAAKDAHAIHDVPMPMSMPEHDHASMASPSEQPTESAPSMAQSMAQSMDMASMPGMQSPLGSYSMMRDGSGTSWQPDTTPMVGSMWRSALWGNSWDLMLHGYVNLVADHQTGPRGAAKGISESMLMLMAQRAAGSGTLGLRAMLSLDPVNGKNGYPLLFQTGETADGKNPLVDRQHPHDALMELAATYSLPVSQDAVVFVYGGLPGEPALGPPAFMHRFSGMRNPEAPLTHHWLDSTHITFGVVTLGASQGPWKIEASSFNGREPDQYRWNIETRRFDSWSTRLSYNPAPAWAMQVSYGDLKSPEQLEPDTRVQRLTASISYGTKLDGNDWQTTFAWGRNHKIAPAEAKKLPGWLLESTYVRRQKHTLFGRYEQVDNDELIESDQPLGSTLLGETFEIRKLSLGYIYDFAKSGAVTWGLGGLVGFYQVPAALKPMYGNEPRSYMLFFQGRL